jgi:ABC-type transporter Mla MlaB component
MLRISIQELPDAVTMKLEGRVSGPWTAELSRAWQSLETSLGSKRLSVDLSGLDFVDVGGEELLREIHQKTRADFIADSPLAKYFAEQAMSGFTGNGKKGA